MSNQTQFILEQLQSLTPIEVTELVGKLEATFDVDVSSGAIAPLTLEPLDSIDNDIDVIDEGTSFEVVLEESPMSSKIAILKAIRSLVNCSLKEAKQIVDSAPAIVRSELSFDSAAQMKQQLEAADAIVSLR